MCDDENLGVRYVMLNCKIIVLLLVKMFINSSSYGAIGVSVNYITTGLWRLDGYYNDGYGFTSVPLSPSLSWDLDIKEKFKLIVDYQLLPVSVVSPDCYKSSYNGTHYWVRQRLGFTDHRIKLGVGVDVIQGEKLGVFSFRVYGGTSLNTLLKGEIDIKVAPEASVIDRSAASAQPVLEKSRKERYYFGFTSIFCVEWAWEKQISMRLGLRAACKFDYADYDDRLYYPDTAVDLKYFLIKYNRMVAISTGINFRF